MVLTEAEYLRFSSEVFEALVYEEDAKVIEICNAIPEGPLHTHNIHDDTVLSSAIYLKRNNLALQLLDMVHMHNSHKLTVQNSGGHTILHHTSFNNKTVGVAVQILARAPVLLGMTNRRGETALFKAATSGKTKIFKLLHREVCRTIQGAALKTFLQRDDKSTILHQAILSRNYLIDADFENTSTMFPRLVKLKKKKYNRVGALKLVKLFVKVDTSWQKTESWIKKGRSTVHQYGKSQSIDINEHELHMKPITPLLLATIYGCKEIVEEILKVYPQAIEHIDLEWRNVLSLAILHRRFEIVELVSKLETQKLLVRNRIDIYGNTLLHLVALKVPQATEDLKGPALLLQEDTLLFKRIKEMCRVIDTMRLNCNGKTADQLFYDNNQTLRSDAKEWMSENAKNCSIVAVLIATVAFAAAYTVPGGPDSKTGHPILKNKPLFFIFTIADAISLSSSLTSVIIFLNIFTSDFRFKDLEKSLFQKLYAGLTLLIISVTMMMVAFGATLILTVNSGRKWTDVTLYGVSFFPVLIFVFTYRKFYNELVEAIYKGFKHIIDTTLSHYQSRKPEIRQYNRRSQHLLV